MTTINTAPVAPVIDLPKAAKISLSSSSITAGKLETDTAVWFSSHS